MTSREIILQRLRNQHIIEGSLTTPEHLVQYMLAMQSQEWYMALWAIGLRLPFVSMPQIEQAFNSHQILRTHVLRPTWHFVAPSDIRWLLQLSAPRVHTVNKSYYTKFELDARVLRKAYSLIEKSLRDKNFMTREEVNAIFTSSNLIADRLRLSYIFMHAELEGLICSGPRR